MQQEHNNSSSNRARTISSVLFLAVGLVLTLALVVVVVVIAGGFGSIYGTTSSREVSRTLEQFQVELTSLKDQVSDLQIQNEDLVKRNAILEARIAEQHLVVPTTSSSFATAPTYNVDGDEKVMLQLEPVARNNNRRRQLKQQQGKKPTNKKKATTTTKSVSYKQFSSLLSRVNKIENTKFKNLGKRVTKLESQAKNGFKSSSSGTTENNENDPPVDLGFVGVMESQIEQLELKTACIDPARSDDNNVYFSGCNIHIDNGLEQTDTKNGKGNLIIGYNEEIVDENVVDDEEDRSGSHYLVVGSGHEYSKWGGLVAGYNNHVAAPYATITGGSDNRVYGDYSSVAGGITNTVLGDGASIGGGHDNTATGKYASISGGTSNTADGWLSSVLGGADNDANGYASTIVGGEANVAETTHYFEIIPLLESNNNNGGGGGGDDEDPPVGGGP